MPLCRKIVATGIKASHVTVAAMILSVMMGLALWFSHLSVPALAALPVFLFIRMALNAIDGMMANSFDQKSNPGMILNETGDIISDSAIILPFMLLSPQAPFFILPIIFLAITTEFVGIIGPMMGAKRRYDGPMGKSDRAFAFGFLALILIFFPAAKEFVVYFFALIIVLLLLCIKNRITAMLKEAQHD